jgi:hypothetical protein
MRVIASTHVKLNAFNDLGESCAGCPQACSHFLWTTAKVGTPATNDATAATAQGGNTVRDDVGSASVAKRNAFYAAARWLTDGVTVNGIVSLPA